MKVASWFGVSQVQHFHWAISASSLPPVCFPCFAHISPWLSCFTGTGDGFHLLLLAKIFEKIALSFVKPLCYVPAFCCLMEELSSRYPGPAFSLSDSSLGSCNCMSFLSFSSASGAEPVRDIRCEFCGEYFENRKGLSSHARSHLRQMGVTEWYVNGSPIDTLREILKRRAQPRTSTSSSPAQGQKSVGPALLGGSLDPRSSGEGHLSAISKQAQQPASPLGHSPTSSPPPPNRKIFSGLPSSLHKKLKQDQLRMEIKREMMSGGLHNEAHLSERAWSPREEMSPLNLCKCWQQSVSIKLWW